MESLAIECQAVKMAGKIICDEASEFRDEAEWTLKVTDEEGLTMFHLSVVGTEGPPQSGAVHAS